MNTVYAQVHLLVKSEDYIHITNVDFEKDVLHLKEQIAAKIKTVPNEMDILWSGEILNDDAKLSEAIEPEGIVFCLPKHQQAPAYEPPAADKRDELAASALKHLSVIANCQISVSSRVQILQKILKRYPHFRQDLGAQALIRDSVLFNSIHNAEVMKKIAETYPIICEAAPFIVETVKKELTKTKVAATPDHETASNTSSEEENSLGANTNDGPSTSAQSENARIRQITRQQLQSALAQATSQGSVNSLQNIAQREMDEQSETPAATIATPTSSSGTDRISSEMLRNVLQRTFGTLEPSTSAAAARSSAAATSSSAGAAALPVAEQMDTPESVEPENLNDSAEDIDVNDIPIVFQRHQYAEQLRTMAQMGFTNHRENITYLEITNGDIENAVNLLMAALT